MTARILIIGGSGFLSGTLARTAVSQGHQVWTITRGQRPVPDNVISLIADRHDQDAFSQVVADAGSEWDLVVDCIGFHPPDAVQDIALFRERTPHLVFISTDFAFHPDHRRLPQNEESDHYLDSDYGGEKRLCELEFIHGDTGDMAWTVFRPCHIYGPGSLLGCLPLHGRDPQLIDRLRAGETLALVGGGYFLQQPILARDLADLGLSFAGRADLQQRIFQAAGPDIAESVTYYRIIAEVLGVELHIDEVPVDEYLAANPASAPFLCHRIYDLEKLTAAGLAVPSTPLAQGLRTHVESMVSR